MSGEFFAGIGQEEVDIRGFKGKAPMFFRDVSLMGGIFLADLGAIRSLLPDERWQPVSVLPGKGLAAISCLEYKDTDIGPYNEVSLSLAVHPMTSSRPSPAGGRGLVEGWRAAAASLRGGEYHAFITQLPVTTEVALHGGVDFFNYPKYLADISFEETAGRRACALRDRKDGGLILEFAGDKLRTNVDGPRQPQKILTLNSYPVMNGRPLKARMVLRVKEGAEPFFGGRPSLRFERGPKAEPFSKLKLGPCLRYSYAPRCEAILFKPEALP